MSREKLVSIALVMLLVVTSLPTMALAQEGGGLPPTYEGFMEAIHNAVENNTVDELWQEIVASTQMPIIYDNRVIFMHEADAEMVAWSSGFLGVSFTATAITPRLLEGTRLGDSNVWMAEAILPYDGRFNYSLVVDGETILRDPLSQYQQLGDNGYVSTIYMPGYVFPETLIPRDDIETGTLTENIVLTSTHLGRDVHIHMYTPAGYDELADLPVIYAADGNNYVNDELGGLVTIVDNLIADGRIDPVIVAFVDSRDIETGENLRMNELGPNDAFAAFLTEELIPYVEENYKADPSREARVLLGVSWGGAMVLHVGLNYSDWFANLAIQSPFLMQTPQIVDAYQALEEPLPLKIFMNQGTYDYDMRNTRLMRDYFVENDYPLLYIETNDQHSWSNWPAVLDEMLIYFFGTEGAESISPPVTSIEE